MSNISFIVFILLESHVGYSVTYLLKSFVALDNFIWFNFFSSKEIILEFGSFSLHADFASVSFVLTCRIVLHIANKKV